MSLADDLLAQSELLARHDRGRPKQANLRRAVSAAYYALFHLILDDAVNLLARGRTSELQGRLRRTFTHKAMAEVCGMTARHKEQKPGADHEGQTVQQRLQYVAKVFRELQQQRIKADYDMSQKFARKGTTGTIGLAAEARKAFQVWRAIRQSPEAVEFLYEMLLKNRNSGG